MVDRTRQKELACTGRLSSSGGVRAAEGCLPQSTGFIVGAFRGDCQEGLGLG